MAIYGNGGEYDITCKITAELKTTTSQFMCVGQAPATTTAGDRTVSLCGVDNSIGAATGTAFHFIGIVQSAQDSNSEVATIRCFGVSKATCAHSVPAFSYIMPYWGVSTTTMAGRVIALADGATMGVTANTGSSHVTIVGRALESGSTGTVISVLINPQMYEYRLLGSTNIV